MKLLAALWFVGTLTAAALYLRHAAEWQPPNRDPLEPPPPPEPDDEPLSLRPVVLRGMGIGEGRPC